MRSPPDQAPPQRGRDLSAPHPGQPEPEDVSAEPEDFRVGRGRPPLHSRFKPGGAGGPGRPKGAKNRATLFSDAFDTPRPVVVDGKKKRLSAQALGYRQLARKVAQGDLKAIDLSEKIRLGICGPEGHQETVVPPLSEAELAILGRRGDD
jgi:hypothetical protein